MRMCMHRVLGLHAGPRYTLVPPLAPDTPRTALRRLSGDTHPPPLQRHDIRLHPSGGGLVFPVSPPAVAAGGAVPSVPSCPSPAPPPVPPAVPAAPDRAAGSRQSETVRCSAWSSIHPAKTR
eukprot:2354536-Pyramimonas_sp.AAC.1